MFYLLIITAILVGSFIDIGLRELALVWLALLSGYIMVNYLDIVSKSEKTRHRLSEDYRSRIDQVHHELLNAKPGRTTPPAVLPGKGKAPAH